MDASLAAIYARVKGRVAEEEFLAKVREASAAFEGLLDDEACALLVLDEMGLNEGAYATLADLKGRSEATVRVSVERLEPPRTFEREGRDPGRVGNVVVSDATGEARLVFWDRDVEKMEDGTLRPGVNVTVVNARVKEGRFGPELHVGPWSVIEVEGALDPARAKLLADVGLPHVLSATAVADADVGLSHVLSAAAVADADVGAPLPHASDVARGPDKPGATTQARPPAEAPPTSIAGTLAWLAPTRTYRPPEGGVGFVCDADVEVDGTLRRVVAWNEAVKAVRGVPIGARIRLENLLPKLRGAGVEWHTTNGTRIERG